MRMPTARDINLHRVQRFKQRIRDSLGDAGNEFWYQLLTEVQQEESAEALEIAAALAALLQGDEPLLLEEKEKPSPAVRERSEGKKPPYETQRPERRVKSSPDDKALPLKGHPEVEMQRYILAVGYQHDVKPGNIVGAIANEADLDSEYIGHIEIYENFSTVDLPAGMPKETFQALKKARVCQQRLDIRPAGAAPERSDKPRPAARKAKSGKPGKKPHGKSAATARPGDGKKSTRKKKPGKKPA
jgi:ATP-dependent RNA helicase DeaD